MVFSSTVFLFVFLPVVLVVYYNPIFKGRTFRNIFLLIASLAFYAWGEPVFVFLMLLSIIITWFLGIKIEDGGGEFKTNSHPGHRLPCSHLIRIQVFDICGEPSWIAFE
jgi:D-alanyl-lipoteichoic acid acyltransferase DltB (MBOAT superfamily)